LSMVHEYAYFSMNIFGNRSIHSLRKRNDEKILDAWHYSRPMARRRYRFTHNNERHRI